MFGFFSLSSFKIRFYVLFELFYFLVGFFMNCIKLYFWVSLINFFEEEGFVGILELFYEIFGVLKLFVIIILCLWSLLFCLSREVFSLFRFLILWICGG